MRTDFTNRRLLTVALGATISVVACAPKRDLTPATVPAWDIVRQTPLAAPDSLSSGDARRLEDGWAALQSGDLATAVSDLERLGNAANPTVEVATALGFLELRLGNVTGAERHFANAIAARPTFVPARSGAFLTALASGNEERAYEQFLPLEAADPDHPLVGRYGATLRLNVAEARLGAARTLMAQSRSDEAATAYASALEVAPEVGGLYLEAAEAELAATMYDEAVVHATRATELEPRNASAFQVLAEARYANDDVAGAAEAYRVAAALAPRDGEIARRFEAIQSQYDDENVPPEYVRIEQTERLTREELAALLYLGLRDAYRDVEETTPVIATDIGESWAQAFIRAVVGRGILEVFGNHVFQPNAFVRREELADSLAAALEILAPSAYASAREASRFHQDFTDLPSENMYYESAALSVSLGLLMSKEGGVFDPQSLVSGAEAVSAVEVLAAHLAP